MRIALIEKMAGGRDYLRSVFACHPNFDAELVCWAEEKPNVLSRRGLDTQREEVPVVPFSILKDLRLDAVIIATRDNFFLQRLLLLLHDGGVKNIFVLHRPTVADKADFVTDMGTLDMDRMCRIPDEGEKPYLVHCEAHVCDHCNLNCKACNHFSPFVKTPIYGDLVQFEADVKRLGELFSNIGFFALQGGEPLLAPELACDMIRVAREYFPEKDTVIYLTTNGLLIPKMSSEFWECIRKHRVNVSISLYPPTQKMLRKDMKILLEQDIRFFASPSKCAFSKFMTLQGGEDACYNNSVCVNGGCHFLGSGLLGKCPVALLFPYMAPAVGLPPQELRCGDAVRLADASDGWEIIRALDAPCETCKMCAIARAKHVAWAPAGPNPDPADWLVE